MVDLGAFLVVLVAFLAFFGTLITSASPFVTHRFVREWRARRARREAPEAVPVRRVPPVLSIVKPLDGMDDGLEENLESFARLALPSFELILTCEDEGDGACGVASRFAARHPELPVRLVTGHLGRPGVRNPKVDRLIAAAPFLRGKHVLISDSNVRVSPHDFDPTLRLLEDPGVGLVSNLFVNEGARTLGAVYESLMLLTFVVPGTVLAAVTEYPCVIGKSMAFPRRVLDEIGGFEAFSGVLAEDQAIAMAIHGRGYRVLLSPAVVRNPAETPTLRAAVARQVRWNRIRFALAPGWYVAEVLMNPFPIALLAAGLAALLAPIAAAPLLAFAAFVALLRIGQTMVLDGATGDYLRRGAALLMPLKDLVQLALHPTGFASGVVWHGHRVRLGRGSRILPAPDGPRDASWAPAGGH
jgi:ceramide glucosyltransferase